MKGALLSETYSKIVGSVIEYTGQPPVPAPQPPAGVDAWKLLDWMVKKLEDKTIWNDVARGQLSGTGSFQDVSGRALLGARELFERSFGPMVRAAAHGATEWAHIIVRYASWLFDTPRLIPAVGGSGRLAKRIDRDQLGDELLIYTDAQTMMPMPDALKNQMLFDLLQNNVITMQQYRERAPFADIRDIFTGGADQVQRAKWINTVLEERFEEFAQMQQTPDPMTGMPNPDVVYQPQNGVTVLWQDDPIVHMGILNEIILDERKPVALRQLAWQRWGVYHQLQSAQNGGGMVPVPPVVLGVPEQQPGVLPPPPPPAPAPASVSGKPGPGQSASSGPAPELSSTVPSKASVQASQGPTPLGEFGAAEAAAQGRTQG